MISNPKSNIANDTSNAIYEVKDDLHAVVNKAGRKLRSAYDTASEELHHATDVVTTQIRQKPVQSSMIALGVGVLIGALLRR